MTFDPKMPTMFFNPKSENIGQMCICARIIKLELGGQQLPVIKKTILEIALTLKNPVFY